MSYIKKCIISKLNHEIFNGDLSDIGNSIGQVVAKFINENEKGYEKESFLHGINHGLDNPEEVFNIDETVL
jgi:hypothetical protein